MKDIVVVSAGTRLGNVFVLEITYRRSRMERALVDSSNVASIGYDPETRTMEVEFKGRNNEPGAIYHYFEVPQEIYEQVLGASSVGQAMNQLVKPIYRFQRIS